MNMQLEQAQIRQRQEALRFQLVATELDLAITFCEIARNTNDPAKYRRNLANALKAYGTALHFLRNDPKTSLELGINKKMIRINFLLGDFDEFGHVCSPAVM